MSSSARDNLLPNSSTPARYDAAPLSEQLRSQDDSLHHLSTGVRTVRKYATLINTEVNCQNAALDDMESQMQNVQASLSSNQQSVRTAMSEQPYTFKSFCILLWPLVLLIVLALEAVIHFIF